MHIPEVVFFFQNNIIFVIIFYTLIVYINLKTFRHKCLRPNTDKVQTQVHQHQVLTRTKKYLIFN
uniref:Uncharacterized protein n=1 Tax=Helianthus annuus TaxID=4232 RepID=A0A251VHJ2_HELAN